MNSNKISIIGAGQAAIYAAIEIKKTMMMSHQLQYLVMKIIFLMKDHLYQKIFLLIKKKKMKFYFLINNFLKIRKFLFYK